MAPGFEFNHVRRRHCGSSSAASSCFQKACELGRRAGFALEPGHERALGVLWRAWRLPRCHQPVRGQPVDRDVLAM